MNILKEMGQERKLAVTVAEWEERKEIYQMQKEKRRREKVAHEPKISQLYDVCKSMIL